MCLLHNYAEVMSLLHDYAEVRCVYCIIMRRLGVSVA